MKKILLISILLFHVLGNPLWGMEENKKIIIKVDKEINTFSCDTLNGNIVHIYKGKYYVHNSLGKIIAEGNIKYGRVNDIIIIGKYIYYLSGMSKENVKLIKVNINKNTEEVVDVGKSKRNPIVTLENNMRFMLRWFNQDPKVERRPGWSTMYFLKMLPLKNDRYVVGLRGIEKVDSDVDFQSVSIVDVQGNVTEDLARLETYDYDLSFPSVSHNKQYIVYGKHGHEANTYIYLNNMVDGTSTIIKSKWPLDGWESQIFYWSPNDDYIIFPALVTDKQTFMKLTLKNKKIEELGPVGRHYRTPYFFTIKGDLVYSPNYNEVVSEKIQE